MELLTRNNFESWMRKLMERLDRQDELLLAMKAILLIFVTIQQYDQTSLTPFNDGSAINE